MPTISLCSRTYPVVDWRCSLNEPGAQRENIEIDASHHGMGLHLAARYAITDRLA